LANAEYKLDPRDGRYRLMEINGRCFLMQGLARRAGVNYPLLAWREAVAGEVLRTTPNLWPGVWVDLVDDVWYGALFRRREGLALADYAASYRRPKTFAVWSAADPLPFLVHLGRFAATAARALGSRRLRAALDERVAAMPGLGGAGGSSSAGGRRANASAWASAVRPGGDRSRTPAPRGPSAPAR
jgi:predicted ATP-grasp superfamily ATP-dependent carboligase